MSLEKPLLADAAVDIDATSQVEQQNENVPNPFRNESPHDEMNLITLDNENEEETNVSLQDDESLSILDDLITSENNVNNSVSDNKETQCEKQNEQKDKNEEKSSRAESFKKCIYKSVEFADIITTKAVAKLSIVFSPVFDFLFKNIDLLSWKVDDATIKVNNYIWGRKERKQHLKVE
ncbi:hypothetical protein GPJ56_008558 [Histomonas meleagridis]|uniref:uncharacterized protein n=1 Tax=Histomonas meleagridis TaxID=135588 RepID=UPI003559A84B|nr:hypothetical protein GPJ56_008558 [Histomonas meleagridis]KAH0798303.1 hypothetical protein GO595_008852 [Histomonas meleagridis]